MSKHRHAVLHEGPDYGYAARVNDAEAAAGNIERQQFCSCGASRWVAINGRHHVEGPWIKSVYGVVAISNHGQTHIVVSTHETLPLAWAAFDRTPANKAGYVACVPHGCDGDVLTWMQRRLAPREVRL